MTVEQPRRKRGVVLTATGRQKLQDAIRAWEEEDSCGDKLTIEALGDRTKLDAGTVAKVLDGEEGVDRRTLERFFQAFNLELTENDYYNPNLSPNRIEDSPPNLHISDSTRNIDWVEVPDVSVFFGRTEELKTLKNWIKKERCRLLILLGTGGIGKTSLAAKLAEEIQTDFEYIVWRSLRNAPPLEEILVNLTKFLSNRQQTDLPENLNQKISLLITCLQEHRCLVILDNMESVFQEDTYVGVYREGYENYGDLLRRVGETVHKSCLVLTSREKPREVTPLEGEMLPGRSLQLSGLKEEAQKILKIKGVLGSDKEQEALISLYKGNPLALKLVATTITGFFEGNISNFIEQNITVVDGVRNLLDQQRKRCSILERKIVAWLAINREPNSIEELQNDIMPPVSQRNLLAALESLIERSLVERITIYNKHFPLFTLQPMIMEYLVEDVIIPEICGEIERSNIILFNRYSLVKAQSKEYVREIQFRLIIKPIIDRLSVAFGSTKKLKEKLDQILSDLRENEFQIGPGYVGGNIVNLLTRLKIDLAGYNFSHLTIWQAYLQGINLHGVNFAHSDLTKSVFTELVGVSLTVAFSADGRYVAAGSSNGEVRIWQVSDGKLLFTFKAHSSWVWAVTFSPDGKTLGSGSSDHTITLWDTQTGQRLKTLQGHEGRIWALDFSPDSSKIASGSGDNTVKLWDVNTGQCLKNLTHHTDQVRSVSFSLNGEMLASSSEDRSIKLWSIDTGKCLKSLDEHNDQIHSIAFSSDGYTLASSSGSNIMIWNALTGQYLKSFEGHTGRVRSVGFSSDGYMLASGSEDQTIKLWDTHSDQCLGTLVGHTNQVYSVAFSPDNHTIASSSDDQTVRLWDTSTEKCLKILQGYTNKVCSVAFSPDSKTLASGAEDQTLRLWNLSTSQCVKILEGHTGWVWSVAFSPDGQTLASGSKDRTVKLWNVSTGECLNTLQGHTGWVWSVAFSPDGQTLASASEDQTVKLWNVSTGECLSTLQGHTGWVWSVAFSPDGQTLASASEDQTVKLWNFYTGECLSTLQGHTNRVRSIAFCTDGRIIISGSGDCTIKVWDIYNSRCLRTLSGHTKEVWTISLSPNSQTLASSSNDHSDSVVRLWDIHTGQLLQSLEGHSDGVLSVAFSFDGQSLATSSQDETIKLWNVRTGKWLKILKVPQPYEGMKIAGVTGLTEAQKASLIALGAVELE
ncbi:MAG: NACHT domain-containing protein [Stenomitos rutilans HA7619-LM2]|jgi:WD40 repeat protein|nr:NACHT domain-containing protein [Stenomitos rutilans HA7619-LM2]